MVSLQNMIIDLVNWNNDCRYGMGEIYRFKLRRNSKGFIEIYVQHNEQRAYQYTKPLAEAHKLPKEVKGEIRRIWKQRQNAEGSQNAM